MAGELYDAISFQFKAPSGSGVVGPAASNLALFVVSQLAVLYSEAVTDLLAAVEKQNQSLEWLKTSTKGAGCLETQTSRVRCVKRWGLCVCMCLRCVCVCVLTCACAFASVHVPVIARVSVWRLECAMCMCVCVPACVPTCVPAVCVCTCGCACEVLRVNCGG